MDMPEEKESSNENEAKEKPKSQTPKKPGASWRQFLESGSTGMQTTLNRGKKQRGKEKQLKVRTKK